MPSKVWLFKSLDDDWPLSLQYCGDPRTVFATFAHEDGWIDAQDLPAALDLLGISTAGLSGLKPPSALSWRGFCQLLRQLLPEAPRTPQHWTFLSHLEPLRCINTEGVVANSTIPSDNSTPTRVRSPCSSPVPYETRHFHRSRSVPRTRSAMPSRTRSSTDVCRQSRHAQRAAEVLRQLRGASHDEAREAIRKQATRWRGEFAPPVTEQPRRMSLCSEHIQGQRGCSPRTFKTQPRRAIGSLHDAHSGASPRAIVNRSPRHCATVRSRRVRKTVQTVEQRPEADQSLHQRVADLEAQVRLHQRVAELEAQVRLLTSCSHDSS